MSGSSSGDRPARVTMSTTERVIQLERSLKDFRSEVDMKMKILEQILKSRNGNNIIGIALEVLVLVCIVVYVVL